MGQAATPPAPFDFMKRLISFTLFVSVAISPVVAQIPQKASGVDPLAAAKQSFVLAEHGKCKEALQLLRKSTAHLRDKEIKLKAGVATVRCAINNGQIDAAVEAIQFLNREFPHDPEVLYITTHAYSDLSTRVSVELATTAPASPQAHEMNAEALELQGKWDDAEKEYQAILDKNPSLPGIHFRLGRLLLSRPNPDADASSKAKEQFTKELAIDPHNAGAEYILGELARQESQWNEAVEHFTKATYLDAGLTEAFLSLGMSLVAEGKPVDAIPPLETYVKLQPANPAGHYQLAMAYSRAGRKEDAKREAAQQRETAEKIESQKAANAPKPTGSTEHPEPPK